MIHIPKSTLSDRLQAYRPLLHAAGGSGVVGVRPVVGWRGRHASALGVHPAVDVVGDVAPGDAAHRAHAQRQRLASFQHLRARESAAGGLR